MLPSAPDTTAAKAAQDLVVAASDPRLVDHVWRTWHFGHHLITEHLAGADLEVAFVAAMLHDIGLTERFDAEEPFELAGARAARDLVAGQGWNDERIELVGTAIAMHLDLASAEERPEVALVHLGASADVVGLRVDQLPGELIEAALAAHPRDGFADLVVKELSAQAERKPDSKIAVLIRDFALTDLVRSCILDHR